MIRIKYADGDYDCVADFMLETLISSNRIEAFYRRSEDRWVVVGDDPMKAWVSSIAEETAQEGGPLHPDVR